MTHNAKLRYIKLRQKGLLKRWPDNERLLMRDTAYRNVSRSLAIPVKGDLFHAQ
ncbi:MAG: hypothetical protein [Arizlama microvirus]|nr:MAG: hypothetical protein [Arizlama microvirus]